MNGLLYYGPEVNRLEKRPIHFWIKQLIWIRISTIYFRLNHHLFSVKIVRLASVSYLCSPVLTG